MKSNKILFFLVIVLVFYITGVNVLAQTENPEKDILMVFDASGSMSKQFGGVSRMEALKKASSDFLDIIDPSIKIGLRVLAQVKNPDQGEACKLTSLIQPFTTSYSAIKSPIALLSPVGSYTPLAYTLTQAKNDFTVGNENVLILLTDGKDTCNGDAASAAADLFNSTKKIKVYVVGLGIDSASRAELQAIAERGGGKYYDVSDSASLAASLKAIQDLERPIDRTNTDAQLGIPVRGGVGFDTALLLNSGKYHLDHNLAPAQYDFFKVQTKAGVPVTMKIVTTDKKIDYNKSTDSFTIITEKDGGSEVWFETNLYDTDRVQIKELYVYGYNKKAEFSITPKENGVMYIRVGKDGGTTDKFSTFTIDNGLTSVTTANTPAPVTNTTAVNNTSNVRDSVTNAANNSSATTGSNLLLYIVSGLAIILVIVIIVVLTILLRKKTSTNIPPTNNPTI